MISWGTKYDPIGELNDFPPEKCQICNESNRATYKVEQGYFSLYGLSLFPSSKKYYKICPDCKTRLKIRSNDPNLTDVKRKIKGGVKFKYVWGWLILGPVLVGIVMFLMWAKSLN
ncbi:MAG: zinc-ribbon domain-containing protein [Crocinitomicaceae bacterium]|nr:zinc-ribbon domain-containing protein [Crocinitomicaceae bacterium]